MTSIDKRPIYPQRNAIEFIAVQAQREAETGVDQISRQHSFYRLGQDRYAAKCRKLFIKIDALPKKHRLHLYVIGTAVLRGFRAPALYTSALPHDKKDARLVKRGARLAAKMGLGPVPTVERELSLEDIL